MYSFHKFLSFLIYSKFLYFLKLFCVCETSDTNLNKKYWYKIFKISQRLWLSYFYEFSIKFKKLLSKKQTHCIFLVFLFTNKYYSKKKEKFQLKKQKPQKEFEKVNKIKRKLNNWNHYSKTHEKYFLFSKNSWKIFL